MEPAMKQSLEDQVWGNKKHFERLLKEKSEIIG